MKYNLFLDDIRFPHIENSENDVSAFSYTNYKPFKKEKWIIARSFSEFIDIVRLNGLPEIVSFDNDLGDVDNIIEKTGYDCSKWLCEYCQDNNLNFPHYYIHSMNPTGANNIRTYIENYIKHVEI
jgi:hypothetical protein|tara:strand:- start:117 stop:491 length:375 start_codon:yes stop_codon:yes gene_type:complete